MDGSQYLWKASFGMAPVYNDQGFPITYYATEGMGDTAFTYYGHIEYAFDGADGKGTLFAFDKAGLKRETRVSDAYESEYKSDLYDVGSGLALCEGGTYEVREEVPNDYLITHAVTQNSFETLATDFVNVKLGQLSVSKKATGEGADKNRAFAFKIRLEGSFLADAYQAKDYEVRFTAPNGSEPRFEDGVAKVGLKDGERIQIELPAGFGYQARELDANTDGYTVQVNGEDMGAIQGSVSAEAATEVRFVNTYHKPKPSVKEESSKPKPQQQSKKPVPIAGDSF